MNDITQTSPGRAAAQGAYGTDGLTKNTPLDMETEDQESLTTIDTSPHEGTGATANPTFKIIAVPCKIPGKVLAQVGDQFLWGNGHIFASLVTPSLSTTATSTISSITSPTLRQATFAGVSHGRIEPIEMPTGNEGKDIFAGTPSEGNGPGK